MHPIMLTLIYGLIFAVALESFILIYRRARRLADAPPAPSDLLDGLLPYQRAFVEDAAQVKVWRADRNIGSTFAAVREAVAWSIAGIPVIYVTRDKASADLVDDEFVDLEGFVDHYGHEMAWTPAGVIEIQGRPRGAIQVVELKSLPSLFGKSGVLILDLNVGEAMDLASTHGVLTFVLQHGGMLRVISHDSDLALWALTRDYISRGVSSHYHDTSLDDAAHYGAEWLRTRSALAAEANGRGGDQPAAEAG